MTSTTKRVIAVGLDGFEKSIADELIRQGKLPTFADLAAKAALFALDHGDARDTGLAWEHFSTGQDPDGYERWSAVRFDPATYSDIQEPTRARPFLAELRCPVVAFDVPYLDLNDAPTAQGMANWGAHDPGVACHARPAGLVDEIAERFGPYPAKPYIYGFVWPSPENTADMAARMTEAVARRADITRWLLRERLPDWRLAITVVAELHSAAEALWHGWDASHPLYGHASAAAARQGIEGVYIETDRLIAALRDDHPDADLVVFSMHGMGPNNADVPSMALLPELLFRHSFHRAHLQPREDWTLPVPSLRPDESWSRAVNAQLGASAPDARTTVVGEFTARARALASRVARKRLAPTALAWMPAANYRTYWPRMQAFALPAFYDGQVRVNLEGREAHGMVPPGRYDALLDELENLLLAATDLVTGATVVSCVERPLAGAPTERSETRCDLKVHWRTNAYALDVPGLGVIGPVPQRRTGGHTGAFGYAAILSAGFKAGERGRVSSFDVVPTLLELLGEQASARLTGRSLVDAVTA